MIFFSWPTIMIGLGGPKIIDEHRNAPLTTNASIRDRAKDFVDVLIATRGEDGIGYLSNEAIQDIIMVSRLF
jgi:hypothetical protein